MYIDTSTSKGKYTRHLLRQNYRENGKVRHRTIANIYSCSEEEIECIRLALKHKHDLAALTSVSEDISLVQGLSIDYDIRAEIVEIRSDIQFLGNLKLSGDIVLFDFIQSV